MSVTYILPIFSSLHGFAVPGTAGNSCIFHRNFSPYVPPRKKTRMAVPLGSSKNSTFPCRPPEFMLATNPLLLAVTT